MADHDRELAEMQARMLKRATQRLVESGKSPEEAEQLAHQALHEPSKYKIPTIDELDG